MQWSEFALILGCQDETFGGGNCGSQVAHTHSKLSRSGLTVECCRRKQTGFVVVAGGSEAR